MFNFTPFGFRGEMTAPTYRKEAKSQAVSRRELSIIFQDILGDSTAFGSVDAHDDGDPILEHEHPTATEAENAEPLGFQEVAEMIAFPGGPDIPCVRGFDCTTDRLFLDFEGSEDNVPDITIDFDTFPCDALVRANGIAVTLIIGAEKLTENHVDIFMSGTQPHLHHTPTSSSWPPGLPLLKRRNGEDTCTSTLKTTMTMH